MFGLSIFSDYYISDKISGFFCKSVSKGLYVNVIYLKSERNPLTFDCTPCLKQAVTKLHLSPSEEADPLTFVSSIMPR
jgi:hypothetical protein